jgi:response regulator RpfG family c-di-GMP phosphodiesterase
MLDERWLGAELLERKLIKPDQLRAAVDAGGDLCLNLLAAGAIQEHDLLRFLGLHFRTRYVTTEKLSQAKVPQWVLELLPIDLCEQFTVVPVRSDKQSSTISIITPDPSDERVHEAIRAASMARRVDAYVSLSHAVEAAIRKWYKGDIHAFSRVDQMLDRGYPQMLDIYDARAIDLGEKHQAEADDDEPLEIDSSALPEGSAPRSRSGLMPFSAKPLDDEPAAEDSSGEKAEGAATGPQPKTAQTVKRDSSPSVGDPDNLERLIKQQKNELPSDAVALQNERERYFETCAVLINLLEMGHGWRQGHSAELARMVGLLAKQMGLTSEESWHLRLAALFHELGKPVDTHLTPVSIEADPSLRELAARVYSTPARLLEAANLPQEVTRHLAALYEKVDGDGTPGKLSNGDVTLGSRLLSVLDTCVEIMQNPRAPGGRVTDRDQALERIKGYAEKGILDSAAADVFLQLGSTNDDSDDPLLGSRPRILVIDPDREATTVLELKLISQGYDVRVVKTTAEAAREVLGGGLDLILSEVTLNPVDGFGFLARIRQDPRTKSIPLIFLTERSDAADVNRGFELGAVDYITKPVNLELLLPKIRVALGKSGHTNAQRGVSGSLEEMSLTDILQILSAGKKNGALRLRFPSGNGEIFLDSGKVVEARYAGRSGEDAFYAMLPLKEGIFRLDPDTPIPSPTIRKPTEALMLEAMRRFDESRR